MKWSVRSSHVGLWLMMYASAYAGFIDVRSRSSDASLTARGVVRTKSVSAERRSTEVWPSRKLYSFVLVLCGWKT